ncbi:serine/threonine-protein kinase [Streptomyces sp. C10-9-1]|uniref:serine/threonine-protein kinase n=1 Tax=Streptomyces sp. C10-9-1 TaxID=1859285 RepID=UPI003D750795
MTGHAHGDTVFKPLGDGDPGSVAGYRLAARLGAGGMGKVYLSYTPGGRAVAIKVIRPDFGQDAEFRRRFAQEVQAAQRVQGLFTAPVIDADAEAEQPWLATAYVPGPSLADAVVQHGRLPVQTVLLLVAGVAEALQVIHGAGIVHRDLKPANVLLAADGPRVIDFGIARAADATSLTGSGVTIGTPSFMAPEQAAGSRITPATDIFALGQITAYAATGRAAFGEGTSHGVLYRIVHEEPDLTGLPEELRELVTRCMAKAPEDRPSVADILALCQAAGDGTVLRRPDEWLPGAVAQEIATRKAAPAPPAAQPTHPAAPPTHPATVPAAPATPPPGFGPPTPPSAPQAPTGPQPGHTTQPAYGYPATPGPHTPGYGHPHPAAPQQPGGPTPHAGTGPVAPVPAPSPGPARRTGRTAVLAVAALLVLAGAAGGGAYLALSGGEGSGEAAGQSRAADPGGGGAEADAPAAESPAAAPEATPEGTEDDGGQSVDLPPDEPLDDPESRVYQGLNIVHGYHLTLDDEPLKPVDDSTPSDLRYSGLTNQVRTDNGKLILLRSSQSADLDTCRTETRYATIIDLKILSKGSRFCVLTNSGHVGVATYQGTAPETDPSAYITLDMTVWRDAIERAAAS